MKAKNHISPVDYNWVYQPCFKMAQEGKSVHTMYSVKKQGKMDADLLMSPFLH